MHSGRSLWRPKAKAKASAPALPLPLPLPLPLLCLCLCLCPCSAFTSACTSVSASVSAYACTAASTPTSTLPVPLLVHLPFLTEATIPFHPKRGMVEERSRRHVPGSPGVATCPPLPFFWGPSVFFFFGCRNDSPSDAKSNDPKSLPLWTIIVASSSSPTTLPWATNVASASPSSSPSRSGSRDILSTSPTSLPWTTKVAEAKIARARGREAEGKGSIWQGDGVSSGRRQRQYGHQGGAQRL